MNDVCLSVTNKPLVLNVPIEQVFEFLANMENESLWHPEVEKLKRADDKKPGLGAKFVSQNKEDGIVELCIDEFVPYEHLGNTIVIKGRPTERWSGVLKSNSEGQTLLIQNWEVLRDRPLDKDFIEERRKSILAYYTFLDPYLKKGIETYAKQTK